MNTRIAVLLVALAGSILFGQAVQAEVTRLSEPVAVTDDAEVFGAPLNPDARPASLTAVLDDPRDYLDTAIRVETRIERIPPATKPATAATLAARAAGSTSAGSSRSPSPVVLAREPALES